MCAPKPCFSLLLIVPTHTQHTHTQHTAHAHLYEYVNLLAGYNFRSNYREPYRPKRTENSVCVCLIVWLFVCCCWFGTGARTLSLDLSLSLAPCHLSLNRLFDSDNLVCVCVCVPVYSHLITINIKWYYCGPGLIDYGHSILPQNKKKTILLNNIIVSFNCAHAFFVLFCLFYCCFDSKWMFHKLGCGVWCCSGFYLQVIDSSIHPYWRCIFENSKTNIQKLLFI